MSARGGGAGGPGGPGRNRISMKDAVKPDYKDMNLLQKCVSVQGKLYDRKRLGTTAKYQRQLSNAVKRARFLGLLRYVGK